MMKSNRYRNNQKLAIKLAIIMLAMFGFGFALVPLYNVFCDITGLNGKGAKQITSVGKSVADDSRWVTVEFLSSTNVAGDWGFQPTVNKLRVRPGRLYSVSYQAHNPTDQEITVQAISSIAPGTAASYISKIECFCFHQQRFAPAEQRLMPVRFMVNTALPREVGTVSIAYTLFKSVDRERSPGS